MRNRKLGRVFGLAIAAALSLMAFTAISAQAGVFKYGDPLKPVDLLIEVKGAQEGLGTLLVPGRNLTLVCHTGKVLAGSHIINEKEGLGKVIFESCLPFAHLTGKALPCTVHPPEATAKLLPRLHNNEPYVQADADDKEFQGNKTFTTVIMLGESCPLPESNPVVGNVSAKVTINGQLTNLVQFSPAISTLLVDTLKFGGSAATIEGSATLETAGAHPDLKFGVA